MEPQYIKNLGNWKPETQYECYSDNTPIKIMKIMSGDPENHKVHYNLRTVYKPPEEHQIIISPFIEKFKISLNALYAFDTRETACALLGFMGRGRTVLIQDFTQLINIGCAHILFDYEVFKTELLLNYKETLDTFCITSVNPASQSL